MKTISISGTIGRDAETRQAGQTTVTSFSVAVDDGWGENKTTIWFDCSVWGTRGEKVAQYMLKGGKVSLSGEFGMREHNGKTYLQIRVAEFDLPSNKHGQQSLGGQSNQQPNQGGYGGGPGGGIGDEIPFHHYPWSLA